MDLLKDILRKKGLDQKKVKKVLTDTKGSDKEKQSVFDNMKQDFMAHLSDRQSDRNDQLRRSENCIRQHYQSLLMQIPSDIQELTLEDIFKNGGSLDINDGTTGTNTTIGLKIPKSMINSTIKLDVPKGDPNNNSSEPKKARVLKSLSSTQIKTARKPNPNEEIVTLEFSTSGTPLLVEPNLKNRIKK